MYFMRALVLATERNFPGAKTGEIVEQWHYVLPGMCLLVVLFFFYGAYVANSPLTLITPKKQVDMRKAWALFLKFDRRAVQRLDFDDLTCFMSIVHPDGKSMKDWNIGYYQRIVHYVNADVSEGISFPGFLCMYDMKFGDCAEHYEQVFETERSELAKYVINEDPVENVTAVEFANVDVLLKGKFAVDQFEACFDACCTRIGIPEPHDEWYPLAFSSYDEDGDGLISYAEFHRTVQQYRDHCNKVEENYAKEIHAKS